ncbi:MAG: cell division topological specificity factor MinE [Hungatella sp.]|nr:cell division topological specificity factor MinE [Hungatella sp.]
MFCRKHVFGSQSGEIARKRLKLLLVADKTNCSPEFLEMIKDDIFAVVSKYLEINSGDIEVGLTKAAFRGETDYVPVLYAAVPVSRRLVRGHFNAVI